MLHDSTTHGLLSVGDEDVETVDLSLVEGEGVVTVSALGDGRESDDALLGLDGVLLVL